MSEDINNILEENKTKIEMLANKLESINNLNEEDSYNLIKDEYKTFFSPGRQPTISWESRKGLKNSYGGKQSPATRMEHEFDHAIDNINNSHNHRIRREEADAQYDNKEEKRVITGSERKTARANKEDIRYNHKGKTFDVSGSTKVY